MIRIALVMSVILPLVHGQIDKLEQECNILQTLEVIQNRLNEQDVEIAELKDHLVRTENEHSNAIARLGTQEELVRKRGSTYIRWGRTACPGNGSELVYSGYAGGSHQSHSGAASDYLCLPSNPQYAHYIDGVQAGGYVYGGEYEFGLYRGQWAEFFPHVDPTQGAHARDAPCAVCRTARSSVLMVPARTTCHDGWTLEYTGYLSSGHHNNVAASQYVCLDGGLEYLAGGSANDNGKLFTFVEGRCGSLRCPPYVEGRELTCAVCSL